MKSLLPLAALLAAARLTAEEPPATPPAGTTPPATPPAAVPSAPSGAEPAEATAGTTTPDGQPVVVTEARPLPEGLEFGQATEAPPADGPAATAGDFSGLRYTDRLLADPEADITTPPVSTNALRIQGIGARAVKPSKFGSFLQLFNPFAPVSEGMEAQPVSWYDGQLNTAAKPRALRDDKTETPVGGVVVSVGK